MAKGRRTLLLLSLGGAAALCAWLYLRKANSKGTGKSTLSGRDVPADANPLLAPGRGDFDVIDKRLGCRGEEDKEEQQQLQERTEWMDRLEACERTDLGGVAAVTSRSDPAQSGSRRVFDIGGVKVAMEARSQGEGKRVCLLEVIRPRGVAPSSSGGCPVAGMVLRVVQRADGTGVQEEVLKGSTQLLALRGAGGQDEEVDRSVDEGLWGEVEQLKQWLTDSLGMEGSQWGHLMRFLAPGFSSLERL